MIDKKNHTFYEDTFVLSGGGGGGGLPYKIDGGVRLSF